jgi:IclR family mhp operon transcriptional activator
MTQAPHVRAVHRALDILDFLSANGPSSLQRLHAGTGLSKGALRRLLATLAERRVVRLGLSDGMYRANIAAPGRVDAERTARIGRLVEAARPHMLALTARVRWPSDLHIYADGRMHILESTHGLSPFGVEDAPGPNAELNIFASASGLAWLATLGETDVLTLVHELADDEFGALARFGVSPARLLADLAAVRAQGYATRRVSQRRQDHRRAIAVAITTPDGAIGALTISWRREAMTVEAFAALHAEPLRHAAEAVSAALAESVGESSRFKKAPAPQPRS